MSCFHYVNGEIKPESDAHISIFDLGVLRGYGVFDYVQLYSGKPFHLQVHLERLKKSAEGIGLDLPLSLEQIEGEVWKVIEKNPPVDAGLRIMITGGESSRDFLVPDKATSLIMLFQPTARYPDKVYAEGLRAITTSTLRLYPHVKSNCYLPAIMAMRDAEARGYHDALYINKDGGILEGTTCNAFFVQDGKLVTDDSDLIVRGVTRDIVLKLAADLSIEFRAAPLCEVASFDEAFLTSSIKDCVPLVQVNDEIIGDGRPGPITEMLRDRFRAYVRSYFAENPQMIGSCLS